MPNRNSSDQVKARICPTCSIGTEHGLVTAHYKGTCLSCETDNGRIEKRAAFVDAKVRKALQRLTPDQVKIATLWARENMTQEIEERFKVMDTLAGNVPLNKTDIQARLFDLNSYNS